MIISSHPLPPFFSHVIHGISFLSTLAPFAPLMVIFNEFSNLTSGKARTTPEELQQSLTTTRLSGSCSNLSNAREARQAFRAFSNKVFRAYDSDAGASVAAGSRASRLPRPGHFAINRIVSCCTTIRQ